METTKPEESTQVERLAVVWQAIEALYRNGFVGIMSYGPGALEDEYRLGKRGELMILLEGGMEVELAALSSDECESLLRKLNPAQVALMVSQTFQKLGEIIWQRRLVPLANALASRTVAPSAPEVSKDEEILSAVKELLQQHFLGTPARTSVSKIAEALMESGAISRDTGFSILGALLLY